LHEFIRLRARAHEQEGEVREDHSDRRADLRETAEARRHGDLSLEAGLP